MVKSSVLYYDKKVLRTSQVKIKILIFGPIKGDEVILSLVKVPLVTRDLNSNTSYFNINKTYFFGLFVRP